MACAFADPLLRMQGLASDNLGDCIAFFGLSEDDALRVLDDPRMDASTLARRIRGVAAKRDRCLITAGDLPPAGSRVCRFWHICSDEAGNVRPVSDKNRAVGRFLWLAGCNHGANSFVYRCRPDSGPRHRRMIARLRRGQGKFAILEALFIGQAYIDVTFVADDLPSGDEKKVASEYAVAFGGNAVTAAFACAKLGIAPDLLALGRR